MSTTPIKDLRVTVPSDYELYVLGKLKMMEDKIKNLVQNLNTNTESLNGMISELDQKNQTIRELEAQIQSLSAISRKVELLAQQNYFLSLRLAILETRSAQPLYQLPMTPPNSRAPSGHGSGNVSPPV